MARYLRMPGVSADSDAAALEFWTVEKGDSVSAGDTVASVETEKAVVDIEIDEDAVIYALVAESGSMVPVGDPIAVLIAPGEDPAEAEELLAQLGGAASLSASEDAAPDPAASSGSASAPPAALAAEDMAAPASPPADAAPELVTEEVSAATNDTGGRIFASPLARRVAADKGVDLATVTGSGPRGRIVRADVEAAAAAPAPAADAPAASSPATPAAGTTTAPAAPVAAPAGGTATPHTKLRRLIANRLQESKRTAPHFYLTRHLRVDALLALRAQINAQATVRVSVNDFFVKAAARALVDVPEMNVIWTDDAVVGYDTADVSVAVASERGLVTPTFRSVESMSLTVLSSSIKDAVARANEGRLQQSELEGGTLSISNLGMFGVDEFAAIINPPQAAILAIGAATARPVVGAGGELEAATVVTVTLSVDHRPVDGAIAARWLDRLAALIESPLTILL
ncbi:2-oxo acid dehydrogenase subunit E2 [Microbacterium mcarthurae (nom. nud.)]|uniref:Dihydrolipoamide acetyltransferase component of pyruvate dehydrogenase complex n=1 Tax=Microbacterium mcarthurae TaxID=3035918 RepID=A0ABW9GFK0_9MICO